MIISADTSPLIALSGIRRLDLLKCLFGKVLIPPAVFREVVTDGDGSNEAVEVQQAIREGSWMKLWSTRIPHLPGAPRRLAEGETEAITLAKHLGCACLLDERLGRDFAEACGVDVFGSLGVPVHAKQAGMIPLVGPLAQAMMANGIFFSKTLVARVLARCGE